MSDELDVWLDCACVRCSDWERWPMTVARCVSITTRHG